MYLRENQEFWFLPAHSDFDGLEERLRTLISPEYPTAPYGPYRSALCTPGCGAGTDAASELVE